MWKINNALIELAPDEKRQKCSQNNGQHIQPDDIIREIEQ
jgi:hypothetical protein